VICTERTGQFGLHGLRRSKRVIQPGVLLRERLISLVDLVRKEDGLGLAMRPERDGLGCQPLTSEPCNDPGKPLPHLGQRVHMDHCRISHTQ